MRRLTTGGREQVGHGASSPGQCVADKSLPGRVLAYMSLPGRVVAYVLAIAFTSIVQAQDLPISVGDSGVGYIDSAVIANQVRFRFDATFDADKVNRGEYLWAWSPPAGPGPPLDESSTDYQRLATYIEWAVDPNFSIFAEGGALLSNPVINDNSGGLGDIETGFKARLYEDCDTYATFQMKVYIPSGDEDRGLGTGHVSLEPGILFFQQCGSVTIEGELRDWIPVGGTPDRQSNILRYGVGASTNLCCYGLPGVRPVVELAGWTLLDGQARFLTPTGFVVEDAEGDTIINLKAGARMPITPCRDLYIGYGHALTGDRWYRDIVRAEVRWRY